MEITYAGKLASGLQYVLMLKCFCKLFVSCFSIPLSKLSSAAVVLYEAKKPWIIAFATAPGSELEKSNRSLTTMAILNCGVSSPGIQNYWDFCLKVKRFKVKFGVVHKRHRNFFGWKYHHRFLSRLFIKTGLSFQILQLRSCNKK